MIEIPRARKERIFSVLHQSWPSAILGSSLFFGAILYYAVLGFPGLPYFFKDSAFLLGWRSFAEHIEQAQNRPAQIHENPLVVVGLDKYRLASGLAFYRTAALENSAKNWTIAGAETAGRNLFGQNSLMYMFWCPSEQYAGRDMILVAEEPSDLTRKRVTESFESMGAIKEVHITKNNKPVRLYYYRLGYEYRPTNIYNAECKRLPLEKEKSSNLSHTQL